LFSARIKTGEKEPIIVMVVDSVDQPMTGLTNVKIKVRRTSDNFYLDWSDNEFKASPTQLLQELDEVSSALSPGEYYLNTPTHVDGFDTSTLGPTQPIESYVVTAVMDGGGDAANMPQIGEIKMGGFVDDVVEDRYPVIF